jgi:hypothetical protein
VDYKTRRGLLRLALAGPAVLAGLQVAGLTAHADDGDADEDDEHGDRGDDKRGRGNNPRINLPPGRRGATFNSDLVPVNAVNTSDFNPGNSDSGFGSLSVGSAGTTTSSVSVMLRGATANQAYTLAFIPLGSPGTRLSLGSFTTNANGNGRLSLDGGLPESGSAPDRLGTRVGVFVLRRGDINGPDAFVTAA